MRTLHRLNHLLVLLMLLSASACDRNDSAPKSATAPLVGSLSLSGSSTMAPLMQAVAARFGQLHPGVSFDIQGGGSNRGIDDAHSAKVDIGMVSKALVQDRELIGIAIARDGGAILLHRDNPVTQLSDDQVRAIFTGRLKNWKAVGGADAPIHVIDRDTQRGIRELFLHYFKLTTDALRAGAVGGDNAATLQLLRAQPAGIVFFSVGEGERRIAAGEPIKLLPAGGVAASRQSIQKGDYPITRPLTLVTRGLPQGLAKTFIAYARSPAVHDLLEQYEFVPYLD